MPTYDYYCESCEKKFTFRHSVKEVINECKICHGEINKVVSFSKIAISKSANSSPDERVKEAEQDLKELKKEIKRKNNEL